MALTDQINVTDCTAAGAIGTGLQGCRRNIKLAKAIGLLDPSYVFDPDVDFNRELIDELQITGKLVILPGVVGFAWSTPDNTYFTRESSGDKSLQLQYPYEATVTFDNGIDFQAALDSVSGKGNYRAIIFDKDDVAWMTQNKSGDVMGFQLSVHQVGNYIGEDGTNQSAETFFIQFANRAEIDRRPVSIKMPDVASDELDGINDISVTVSPLANGATTLTWKPILQDGTHLVKSLAISNYLFEKNGTPFTPTALVYNDANKTASVTIPAAATGEVYTVQTHTASPSSIITQAPASSAKFKSNEGTVVATA